MILIIEDDLGCAKLIQLGLKTYADLVATIASSAEEAISLLSESIFNGIVLDIVLEPGKMDGFKFLEWKRGQREEIRSIPVLVLTCLPSISASELAKFPDVCEWVTKPVEMRGLALSLASHCLVH